MQNALNTLFHQDGATGSGVDTVRSFVVTGGAIPSMLSFGWAYLRVSVLSWLALLRRGSPGTVGEGL